MRLLLALPLALLLAGPAAADGTLEGQARRGTTYARIAMDEGTARACAALCDSDAMCRSWVWSMPGLAGPDAQCDLLSSAPTPFAAPGRITGLSAGLSARLETASERAPTAREIEALLEAAGHPRK